MSLRRALLLHGALLAAGLSVQGAGGNRHSLSLLAPLRDGGGIEGADGRPSACVEINRCGSGARRSELHATPPSVGGVAVEKVFRTDA